MTYGQIGTAVLMMTISATATQPVFGYLADRRDPRRIVVVSLIWGGVLMGLTGFSGYAVLAGLMVLAALGSAAFHPSAASLASVVESQNRGRAMSILR
ncbi:MAG: MFS transporter [Chloroflexota bacterium]